MDQETTPMPLLLASKDLVAQIKDKQHQVSQTLIDQGVMPKLAIVVTVDNPVINTYMKLKQHYGANMGIEVEIHTISLDEAPQTISELNEDTTVHGIIIQLPLSDPEQTEEVVNLVSPSKDVDGLGREADFIPATPMAILWLIAGYQIDLHGKKVVLVGRGKLVGAPLERLLQHEGIDVTVVTRSTPDMAKVISDADVLVTATGSPGVVTSNMIKAGAVVVDAGVAGEGGKTVGDLAIDVYERSDITVTPAKGGVGPLTVCALFENVLHAASSDSTESAIVFYKEGS